MSDESRDDTRPKQGGAPPWQPGQSGNPAGRPKGARSKLGEAFLEAMNKDFEKHGAAVIAAVRKKKPDQYLKVVASILPKDLNVNINNLDNLTDEQLTERIRELSALLGPFLAPAGARGSDGGDGAETADQSAGEVPTIQ